MLVATENGNFKVSVIVYGIQNFNMNLSIDIPYGFNKIKSVY